MMKKLWKWVKSPFRITVTNQPYEGDIISMCPWRGDVLIAMRDGTMYVAHEHNGERLPVFSNVGKLRCH